MVEYRDVLAYRLGLVTGRPSKLLRTRIIRVSSSNYKSCRTQSRVYQVYLVEKGRDFLFPAAISRCSRVLLLIRSNYEEDEISELCLIVLEILGVENHEARDTSNWTGHELMESTT